MSRADLAARARADLSAGLHQSVDDITVAKLVVMPFVLTVVIWLGWLMPLPTIVAIALFAVLIVPATLWNAGWRARTSAED